MSVLEEMGEDMLNKFLFNCEIFARICAVSDPSTSIDLALGGPGMLNAGSYLVQSQGAKHSCFSQDPSGCGSRHLGHRGRSWHFSYLKVPSVHSWPPFSACCIIVRVYLLYAVPQVPLQFSDISHLLH